ncbi:hypothetical protein KUTeg_004485 [Tegillarca granosa]|uniref:Uncharacterized protein n=1 Tax=Tegillarca granosa TaxID=220873 RepID=A0ABQ9FQ26_TEGGR|nr:hypothetical protein KUTeg_004485 [Tegillarca granosa]
MSSLKESKSKHARLSYGPDATHIIPDLTLTNWLTSKKHINISSEKNNCDRKNNKRPVFFISRFKDSLVLQACYDSILLQELLIDIK